MEHLRYKLDAAGYTHQAQTTRKQFSLTNQERITSKYTMDCLLFSRGNLSDLQDIPNQTYMEERDSTSEHFN